jgi:hypothetical protein
VLTLVELEISVPWASPVEVEVWYRVTVFPVVVMVRVSLAVLVSWEGRIDDVAVTPP